MRIAAVLSVLIFFLLACSDRKRGDEKIYLKDSIQIKNVPKTLDAYSDVNKIAESYEIPDSLLDKWIRPLSIKRGKHNKILSYQFEKNHFQVILIGIVANLSVDLDDDENSWSEISQYLFTVDGKNHFIDGVKVQEYIAGEIVEDSLVFGDKSILSIVKMSEFRRDSIFVFDKVLCLKETLKGEREDYIDTPDGKKLGTLETVLQEEFEATTETTYLIGPDGKINKVGEKKGELKKLSEDTGERIKA